MIGESGYARREGDAYFTEPRVTKALCSAIKLRDLIWEPAAGRGDMANTLRDCGYGVIQSDIAPQFCPGPSPIDFLSSGSTVGGNWVSIVTNPPYSHQDEFVEKAIRLTQDRDGMVAMLLRNEFDSAKSRSRFFGRSSIFRCKLVLTFRPRWDWWETDKPKASPRHNFSWFVWDWLWAIQKREPTIGWLP